MAAQPVPPVANPLPSLGVTIALPPGMAIVDEEGLGDAGRTLNAVYQSFHGDNVERITLGSQLASGELPLRDFAEKFAAVPLSRPFTRSAPHKICNGTQDGWLVEGHFVDGPGTVTLVAGEFDGLRAFASAEAASVKALDTFCVKGRITNVAPFPKTLLDYVMRAYGISLDIANDSPVLTDLAASDGSRLMSIYPQRTAGPAVDYIVLNIASTPHEALQQYVTADPMLARSAAKAQPFTACNGTQGAWHIVVREHQRVTDWVLIISKTRAASVSVTYRAPANAKVLALLKSFCVK